MQEDIKNLELKEVLTGYQSIKEKEAVVKKQLKEYKEEIVNRMEAQGVEKIEASGVGKFSKTIKKTVSYIDSVKDAIKEIKTQAENDGDVKVSESVVLRFTKEKITE